MITDKESYSIRQLMMMVYSFALEFTKICTRGEEYERLQANKITHWNGTTKCLQYCFAFAITYHLFTPAFHVCQTYVSED